MTDLAQDRKPDKLRAVLVWIYLAFPLLLMLSLASESDSLMSWPSFVTGSLTLVLVELVAGASWGFWTGRLR